MISAYYGILPADVRYDKTISASAKLLYVEITSLCSQKGFCWAGNEYFAELFETSDRTIRRWINELTTAKYIRINNQYKGESKCVVENRCISISNSQILEDKMLSNVRQMEDKNVRQMEDKNVRPYNRFNNNKSNTKREIPTLDEIVSYCHSKNLENVNSETFFDYYTSNGWKVGGNPIKDWQAALRNWNRREKERKHPQWKQIKPDKTYTSDELNAMFDRTDNEI